ncbi:hypothetical protein QS306_05715 [Paraburkholderia bonniea]|uniref:hypothetical protein n=1 Tax=Paraburkholderia bonniea TaxID=2152891 RepID=UPI002573CB6A|nr:hypothetical protein [Paraburkholderia bonniea]WJF91137.1 hypothetical protein QS306_05715 [Paraburkholderia bonniea]WJF94452.1 hypothetical protein QS308_05720 [Paraburkholderia bonniea]
MENGNCLKLNVFKEPGVPADQQAFQVGFFKVHGELRNVKQVFSKVDWRATLLVAFVGGVFLFGERICEQHKRACDSDACLTFVDEARANYRVAAIGILVLGLAVWRELYSVKSENYDVIRIQPDSLEDFMAECDKKQKRDESRINKKDANISLNKSQAQAPRRKARSLPLAT